VLVGVVVRESPGDLDRLLGGRERLLRSVEVQQHEHVVVKTFEEGRVVLGWVVLRLRTDARQLGADLSQRLRPPFHKDHHFSLELRHYGEAALQSGGNAPQKVGDVLLADVVVRVLGWEIARQPVNYLEGLAERGQDLVVPLWRNPAIAPLSQVDVVCQPVSAVCRRGDDEHG
jgi:hypothetical protein